MKLVFLLALVAVAIGFLPNLVAGAGTLDQVDLRHQMKVSFCLEQRGKRFYRTENLEDLCTLKVAFFDDLVSINNKLIVRVLNFAFLRDVNVCCFVANQEQLYIIK